MKTIILGTLLAVCLASCQDEGGLSSAQEDIWKKRADGNSANNNANSNDPNDPAHAPIDGGMSVLLLAGAAYGVKRYRAQRNKPTK